MDPETTLVVAETPSPAITPEAADAAVEIARIEAERDVEIAEINAETTETIVEAQATEDEDLAWLRGELDSLRARCETSEGTLLSMTERMAAMEERQLSQEQMTALVALLTPPPNSEEPPADQGTGSEGGEAGPRENQEAPEGTDPAGETPPAPAPQRKRRFLQ